MYSNTKYILFTYRRERTKLTSEILGQIRMCSYLRIVQHLKEPQHVGVQQLLHDGDFSLDVLEEGFVGPAVLFLLEEVLREDLDREQLVGGAVFA